MKNQHTPKLEEVPYVISQKATLCRGPKGHHTLRLEQPVSFICEQQASFGDAHILLLKQGQCFITFQILDGIIPATGMLRQHRITATAPELFNEFEKHWEPFWMRDTTSEQFDCRAWTDFMLELEKCPMPHMHIPIVLDDLQLWKKAIKKLKSRKAEGVCGWRHEELQRLPDEAIEHLMKIFHKWWEYGFTHNMMQARTILLSKVSNPTSISNGRPAAILSVLYRLASKIIFEQVVIHWNKHHPPQISGGLPTRGARDMVLMQACEIEKSIELKVPLCGSALDLSKAFNLIPRFPASQLPWALISISCSFGS